MNPYAFGKKTDFSSPNFVQVTSSVTHVFIVNEIRSVKISEKVRLV